MILLRIGGNIAAVASGHRGHNARGTVCEEPHRAVGKREVAAARMQAPKVELIADLVDVPRTECKRPDGTGVHFGIDRVADVDFGYAERDVEIGRAHV